MFRDGICHPRRPIPKVISICVRERMSGVVALTSDHNEVECGHIELYTKIREDSKMGKRGM